jgi:hypothetical protein
MAVASPSASPAVAAQRHWFLDPRLASARPRHISPRPVRAPQRKRHAPVAGGGAPGRLVSLLREVKRHVEMRVIDHTHAFGAHQAARWRTAREYLFTAW